MRAAWAALAIALAACGGCDGKTVVLGDSSPRPYHFEPPQPIAELAAPFRTDNPTLTADLREIFFTTDRVSGNGDVWFATRADASGPFGAPQPVDAVNTPGFETSAAISADGLTLWFGSDRAGGPGGIDIWAAQRASRAAPWSTPVNVVALCSPADDIPRPPGQHGLVMPMSSARPAPADPNGEYQTYFAARGSIGAPFGAPSPIPELAFASRSTVDAFLTDDGLTLFFSSAADAVDAGTDGGPASSDLYVAWRRSTGEPFSVTQPLDDLNTPGSERDPWLSPDGRTLYFTSDRSGILQIYTVRVQAR
ncbi:MAG TPA: hypothetical protein VHM31_10650 [Polyangia bacterium]|nr:hypothetical protein [Polyangia bacterium]